MPQCLCLAAETVHKQGPAEPIFVSATSLLSVEPSSYLALAAWNLALAAWNCTKVDWLWIVSCLGNFDCFVRLSS